MPDNNPENHFVKGRGAQFNADNPFLKNSYDYDDMDLVDEPTSKESPTEHISVHPKSIINKVDSPDIPFGWSMNPYQGCEHGCIYCYARFSHTYWGYSAGLDFEKKILIKDNAPELLEKKLSGRHWTAAPVMLSGNTDCYQPLEKNRKITRRMLEVLLKYKHPVAIITKNALILRDLDLLSELAKLNLVKVAISITSLNEELRRKLEPRTSTGLKRLEAVKQLTGHKIPTSVMMAPVIPGLNNYEIPEIIKRSAEYGANDISYQTVRLRGEIFELFENWIQQAFPDRAQKVINQVKELHEGHTTSSEFGTRMKGKGVISDSIGQLFALNRKKYFSTSKNDLRKGFNLDLYHPDNGSDQLKLF